MEQVISRSSELLEEYCKTNNLWGLYIRIPTLSEWNDIIEFRKDWWNINWMDNVCLAAPYIKNTSEWGQHVWNETIFLIYDNEDDMWDAYNITYGDEGSKTNDYNGPMRIYALAIGPNGYITENT